MREIRNLIIPFLLIVFIFGSGLFLLFYGINRTKIENELINSGNKYLATIVNVNTSRGRGKSVLYINFQINGKDIIYKGRENFAAYWNYISLGKKITVIFDQNNKEYIIEDFMLTYQRGNRWLISFGIILITIPLIGTIFPIVRTFLKK